MGGLPVKKIIDDLSDHENTIYEQDSILIVVGFAHLIGDYGILNLMSNDHRWKLEKIDLNGEFHSIECTDYSFTDIR